MKYHTSARVKEEISAIAAGCWGIGAAGWGEVRDEESIEAIRVLIEGGVNLVDTAPVYGLGHSEEIVGRALEGLRDKVLLVSKCGITRKKATGFGENGPIRDSSREAIVKQVHESLERLKTDHLDVLLIHWPDVNTPFEDAAETLKQLKREGLIRYSGVCNFEEDHLARMYARDVLDFIQYQNSLVEDKWEPLLSKYHDLGVATMAYGPLGGGILTGMFRKKPDFAADDMRLNFYPYYREPRFTKIRELLSVMDEIAKEHGCTTADVAISYTALHPSVTTALLGASKPKHAAANLRAVDLELTKEEREILKKASEKAK